MNVSDLLPLLPWIITAATAVVVMLAVALRRNHALAAVLALAGLAAALIALVVGPKDVRHVTALLVIDGYARFYAGLILAASLALTLLSYGYLQRRQVMREEFYILLLLATTGAEVLAASSHFASFFLGLELLSVSLYALVAYPREPLVSIEAGVKYLVLAGASSAFLLFGMALVYTEAGTMGFSDLASKAAAGGPAGTLVKTGVGMIIVAVGFKLALVPFHLWTPDVYQGAPAPVAGFVASVSKGAMFALLLRYFTAANLYRYDSLLIALTAIAVLSMFTGNLLALLQKNVKRILAYSSIAHLGYLLVAFLASGNLAATAVTYYLVAYFVTIIGAFGVVAVLSGPHRDAEDIEEYRGLVWRRPGVAAVFTAMLLSLAGIPLTAGFVGKFFVLAAGVGGNLWMLTVILVINSAIGLFYYLRIIVAIFRPPAEAQKAPAPEPSAAGPSHSLPAGVTLAGLTLALVWLGVYPDPMIRAIRAAVAALFP